MIRANLLWLTGLGLTGLTLAPCGGGVPWRAVVGGAPVAPAAIAVDEETVAGSRHFSRGHPAQEGDDVNAVIEIPCGTTAKFEVADADGWIHWQHDRDHGGRRAIDYLPFPVNYGMVPRTLAEDEDALDIAVLGRGMERGMVAKTRVIGVLKMGEDNVRRDDKLIAVPVDPVWANGFSRLRDVDELDRHYPAVRDILVLWFSHYWGKGATAVLGWGDAAEAAEILERAKREFTQARWARSPALVAADPRPREPSPFAALARSPAPRSGPSGRDSACSAP
jgi:inorganic pyrophosphatase